LTTLSAPEIAALRAMLAKATPGPWDVDCPFGREICAGYIARNSEGDDIGREYDVGGTTTRDDAAAIVAVMSAAPSLLDEIEHLRAALDAAESALARLRSSAGHAASVAVHGDPLAGAVGTIGPKS